MLDAGRTDGGRMEKSNSEIFRSCQPVWNTRVVPILRGDNLAIVFNGSNFSSAHLAKLWGLIFIHQIGTIQTYSHLLASGTD